MQAWELHLVLCLLLTQCMQASLRNELDFFPAANSAMHRRLGWQACMMLAMAYIRSSCAADSCAAPADLWAEPRV